MPSTQGAPGDQPRGAFSFLALGHPHQRKLARHHSYGAFAAAWGDPGRIRLSRARVHPGDGHERLHRSATPTRRADG